MASRSRHRLLAAGVSVALLTVARPARSNTPIVVTSAADVPAADPSSGICETSSGNGVCTLRAAIDVANARAGSDTITFDASRVPNPTTFVLTAGSLHIQDDVTIVGNGAPNTIIDGNASATHDRVFFIVGFLHVSLSKMTIQGGVGDFGGGITTGSPADFSRIFLSEVTVTSNVATSSGGGISVGDSTVLVADRCTITGNHAGSGAGIDVEEAGRAIIQSSTISDNSADQRGGVWVERNGSAAITDSTINNNSAAAVGGIDVDGTLDLVNSTVYGNNAAVDVGGIAVAGSFRAYNATIILNNSASPGDGITVESGGSASLANTILAENFQTSPFAFSDCFGPILSEDYNAIQTTAGCSISGASGHNVDADPQPNGLNDNGGPTRTAALPAGSFAIDAGNPSGCVDPLGATLTRDQRGYVRPTNGRCDMGAYEYGAPPSFVAPQLLAVDPAAGSSDGNGVLEPGESVLVVPSWHNLTDAAESLAGTASSFEGPSGAAYTLVGAAADYGSIAGGATKACTDCYTISVVPDGHRPAAHWDAHFVETPSTGDAAKTWTLHVGDSFQDVPRSQPFYRKIETLLHSGITAGCATPGMFCPGDRVSRGQMAIFLARALAGGGEAVPASGTLHGKPYACVAGGGGVSDFFDVLPTDIVCKSVHFIATQNVTLGCGTQLFCPAEDVSRLEMASFIAKAIVAPGGGAAVPTTYGPDPATGFSYSCEAGSPAVHFTDVPASDLFCRHVHYLWARGIVSGCSAAQFCPFQSVTRDAMAKFLSNAFRLALYGP